MQIKVFQSGGFAGDRIQLKDITEEKLPVEKRPLLHVLLDKADAFYATKTKKSNGDIGADMLQYEIEIPDSNGGHVYKFTNSPNNQPMNDLLQFLLSL